MQRTMRLWAMAAVVLGLWTVGARADGMAFVNMETVFENYYKTFKANAAFDLKKRDFQERLTILQEELEGMVSEARKLEEDVNNELLSEEARADSRRKLQLRSERIRAKQAEFEKFRRGGISGLNRERMKAEEEIIDQLAEFVHNLARSEGYDLVFDINGKSLNRMPVVLHYPEDLDITPHVIAEINRGHEDEVEKAKAAQAAAAAAESTGADDEPEPEE